MAELDEKAGKDKKSGKKWFIIAAVVILLAGGAGAAFYFLKHDSAKAEKVAHSEEEEAAPEELYYEMNKPLTVNFPDNSSIQLAQISVSLLVAGEESVEAVKKHEPMIRNNLLMMLAAQNADNLITREEKEKLRAAMLQEVTTVLKKMTGKSQVKELFFTSFVMQ
ncbi:flagellar basal body-associated FliL family protein [Methylosarcina fibrata]|uniref:flagellar basal body-associated FliL family protein n=1 Tax=Methylosarcina fibrata TaxID=105972 RepID=UPI000369E00A|nr:flagellar basal body-associated FliL family protein [Methylosarcina fibrata]